MNAILLTLALAVSQCPGGVCPAPGPSAVYEWKEIPGSTAKALTLNGVQIGAYDGSIYLPYFNGGWGKPTDCPIPIPSTFASNNGLQKWETSGVDWSECGKRSGNSFRGEPIDRYTAFQKLAGSGSGDIPDRSNKGMITFVDNDYAKADARRKEFMKHEISQHYNVQAYSKDNPIFQAAVDPAKVKTLPTVYFQVSPSNGKVLERVDGDVPVERIIEAAKKHDPTYDPSKDPTGGNVLMELINKYVTKESIAGVVIAILAFLGLVKRPNQTPPAPQAKV